MLSFATVPGAKSGCPISARGMDLGLEWGGNWTSIVDQPHFQLRPAWAAALTQREMLAELRRRVAEGIDVF